MTRSLQASEVIDESDSSFASSAARGDEARRGSGSETRTGRGAGAHPRRRRQPGRRLHPHRDLRAQAAAALHARQRRRRRSRSGRRRRQRLQARRSRLHRRRQHHRAAPAPTPSARSARPRMLHRLPARVSFAQGAALGVPYCTAYRALFHAPSARPGETVLVHGATGGVGIAAVELAHAHGMTVIGTGGTDEGLAAVREHGADVVVNHRDAGLHRRHHARHRRPRRRRDPRDGGAHQPRRDLGLLAQARPRRRRRQPRTRRDRRAAGDGPRRRDPRA